MWRFLNRATWKVKGLIEIMKEIYLDNSATTKVCDASCEKAIYMMSTNYGNPSSLHSKGLDAENVLDEARDIIAKKISAEAKEIYFTSGGTEANNLAVIGTCRRLKSRGNKIVTTAIEHSSVMESAKEMEKEGFEVVYVAPGTDGKVSEQVLADAIDERTILVSVMMVNNETGARQPVESVKKIIKEKKSPALFHVDAVQAFCKTDVNVKKIQCDLMSITAHKVHGPKGIGALFVSKNAKIKPILFGGEQQKKIRPGTESTPLIAAFAAAVSMSSAHDTIEDLRKYCLQKITSIPDIMLNSPVDSIGVLNFSVLGIKSETLLHFLSKKNIFVSSSSACARGKKSYVLKSMGLEDGLIDSAIRVSFSRYNTTEDIDILIDKIQSAQAQLVKIKK